MAQAQALGLAIGAVGALLATLLGIVLAWLRRLDGRLADLSRELRGFAEFRGATEAHCKRHDESDALLRGGTSDVRERLARIEEHLAI